MVAVALLMLNLIPFVATQVQNALYPQLERVGIPYGASRDFFDWLSATHNASATLAEPGFGDRSWSDAVNAPYESAAPAKVALPRQSQMSNMQFDAGTSIQTGMAKPEWYGNQVHCYWDGPVSRDQTIQPILISRSLHRAFTVVRLVLLGVLVAMMLGGKFPLWRKIHGPSVKPVAAGLALLLGLLPGQGWCQIPNEEMLQDPERAITRSLRGSSSSRGNSFYGGKP